MAKKNRAWFIDNSASQPRMGIVEKATNAVTVDVYAIARDYDLVANALTATWTQIPKQFHEHIVNKVIALCYLNPLNLKPKFADYFANEYEKGVKKAKKFSKSNYTTTGFIAPQDF
jgi:hypothetical protein